MHVPRCQVRWDRLQATGQGTTVSFPRYNIGTRARAGGLSFVDAHELTQARDTSLPCSIKRFLRERLDASKTFVLVVGDKTKDLQGRLQILRKLLALWRLP